MNLKPCIGCGGLFPEIEGPTHRYMLSSPGCWACYGKILVREYSDSQYSKVHRLTVDSYAIQHPGEPSPQSIQSIAIHLISLFAILEMDIEMQRATQLLETGAKEKGRFEWLTPPSSMGDLTVADVREAETAEEHQQMVQKWARSAWSAWSIHHEQIEIWYSEIINQQTSAVR